MLLLAACGGGDSGGAATATDPSLVLPGLSRQPAPQPGPPTSGVVLADTYTELGAGTPGWPAWVAPPDRNPVNGVGCLATIRYHNHALVSIYKDGVRQGLPENVGRSGCTYELHTHDMTGMVHIETDVPKRFTLGQFFALWRQPLATSGTAGLPGPIRIYLVENERLAPYTGDPAAIELVAHREIVIISGTPPGVLPKYRWPPGL